MHNNINTIKKIMKYTHKQFKILNNNPTAKYQAKLYIQNLPGTHKKTLGIIEPMTSNDHTMALKDPKVVYVDKVGAFTEENRPLWDDLLYRFRPHETNFSSNYRPMSEQDGLWDDDEETDLMELIGSDWDTIHSHEKQAIQDALDNKDAETLLEVLSQIDWELICTDTRVPLFHLHTNGAIELDTTDIVYETRSGLVPYIKLWHDHTKKLLVPTMIKRECLYMFLQEPILKLQASINSLMNRFDAVKEWSLGFRSYIKFLTKYEADDMDGNELYELHRLLLDFRPILSHQIKQLFRSPDVQTFNFKYTSDTSVEQDQGDSQNFTVIENNPLLILDDILNNYLSIVIDDIRIAENMSRSMMLNPIEIKRGVDPIDIELEIPEVVWTTIDNRSKMTTIDATNIDEHLENL